MGKKLSKIVNGIINGINYCHDTVMVTTKNVTFKDYCGYRKLGIDNCFAMKYLKNAEVSASQAEEFQALGVMNWVIMKDLSEKNVAPEGFEEFCEISGVTDHELATKYILWLEVEAELLRDYREIAGMDVNSEKDDIMKLIWNDVSPQLTKELSDLNFEYDDMPIISFLKSDPAAMKPYIDAGVENLSIASHLSKLNVPLAEVRQAIEDDGLIDLMIAYL